MALSAADRKRALYHLNYGLLSLPTQLSLGDPTVTQARYLIEQNLLFLDPQSETFIITTLDRLDCIEREMDEVRSALIVKRSGSTDFRDDALMLLEDQYGRWQRRLADNLAGQPNPVSNAANVGMGRVIEGM